MAVFEFNQVLTPQSLIDIDNIGDFAIEANNDEGYFWYLILKTSLGVVTIATCGPVIPDVEKILDGYTASVKYMQYKEDKIIRYINMWLNDHQKKLTEANMIKYDDALSQFINLQNALEQQGDL